MDAMGRVFEPAVTVAVTRDVGRLRVADRQRRRTPELAILVIADVDRLARGIADRIVGPGRQLILATIGGPSIPASFGRDLKAESFVGDHIDPRRRRRLAWAEHSDVFLAARPEAAEAVEKFEPGGTCLHVRARLRRGWLDEHAYRRTGVGGAIELIGERPVLRRKDDAGGR